MRLYFDTSTLKKGQFGSCHCRLNCGKLTWLTGSKKSNKVNLSVHSCAMYTVLKIAPHCHICLKIAKCGVLCINLADFWRSPAIHARSKKFIFHQLLFMISSIYFLFSKHQATHCRPASLTSGGAAESVATSSQLCCYQPAGTDTSDTSCRLFSPFSSETLATASVPSSR